MVNIDDAVLARYSHAGKHFEIYVDPELALKVKNRELDDLAGVLAADEIFKDARKGDKASPQSIKETFETEDLHAAAKLIIQKGDLQLTTDQRRKLIDEKKKQIITTIVRESYNPQTKAPHTPDRIETAMDEVRVQIDPYGALDAQVEKVVNAIRTILPISIERLKIEAIIPAAFTGKAYSILKKHNVENEEWMNDGTLKATLTVPAGLEADLYSAVQAIAKGEAQFTRVQS